MEINVTKLARIASLLAFLLATCLVQSPAHAQFAGFGGGGGGEEGDMMTTMAPMLEAMKKKMGKKRFTTLMQTMGPMMEKMGGEGGFGGGGFGGGFGGMGGFDMEPGQRAAWAASPLEIVRHAGHHDPGVVERRPPTGPQGAPPPLAPQLFRPIPPALPKAGGSAMSCRISRPTVEAQS